MTSRSVDRIVTNIRWTLIGQMWTWSMAFVLATVLPRRLGAADVGRLYSSQAIWLIVAAIAAFGTDALIVRSAAADPATLGPIRRGALAARGLMLIVLWPVAAITLWVLGPRSLSVGLVVGVATSATVVGNVWRSILHGREQLAAIAAIDGGVKMVLVGGVLGLLLADAPLALIASAWIPPAVLSALGFLIISRRSGTGDVDSSSLPWRHALREGWPYFATTGAVMIYHQIDVVVIALFGDEDATGWYGAADQLYTSVYFISTAALASVLPAMFRIAKRSPSEIDDMARVGLGLMVTAAVPIGLGLVVTGGDIARLVFGAEFDAAGAILALMGLAVVPTYAATFLGQMAIVLGESALWARLMLGAAFATAAIDVVVVPATQRWFSNGGLGGAISYILVETAVAIVGLQRLRPAIVDRKLLMGLVRALAAGLVMLLCVLLVDGWWLGLRVTVGALVYVAAAIMFDVLTPSQRALIAEASPRHRMIQSLIRGPYRRRSTHDIDGNDTNEESVDAPR